MKNRAMKTNRSYNTSMRAHDSGMPLASSGLVSAVKLGAGPETQRSQPAAGSTFEVPSVEMTALPAGVSANNSAGALWEALRSCRMELAREQGVPPYVIFHDRTLQALALEQPRDLDAFGAISGVGERKREKYGPAFLAVLEAHREATPAPEDG